MNPTLSFTAGTSGSPRGLLKTLNIHVSHLETVLKSRF